MEFEEPDRLHIPDYQPAFEPDPRGDWGPVVVTVYALVLAAVLSFIAWAWLGAMGIR